MARPSRGFSESIGIWKCWFLRRGENRSTRRKTSQSKDENQSYSLFLKLKFWPLFTPELLLVFYLSLCEMLHLDLRKVLVTFLIYHMGSISFVLSGGSNLIFHAHCPLSKKLVAVLIVTGEGGAETIADNNSKTILYIFPQGNNLAQHPPPPPPPKKKKEKHIQPSQ